MLEESVLRVFLHGGVVGESSCLYQVDHYYYLYENLPPTLTKLYSYINIFTAMHTNILKEVYHNHQLIINSYRKPSSEARLRVHLFYLLQLLN